MSKEAIVRKIPLSKVFIDEEIRKVVLEVLDSGWYILGKKVEEFERKFAEFCSVKHAIGVSSGTAALFLSLKALEVGPDDEVLVPSFSFIATVTPVIHVGAKPIFCDIDLRTYTIDPYEIRRKVSARTKAIIPVHLYGHPSDMDPILEIAEKYGLYIIEDACQAHGAEYKGKKIGSISHIACFSFYPSKNMTVCGDGGAVVTNDDEIAEKIEMLRNHGREEKYVHKIIGYNLRFNEIKAAIGIKQLEKLPQWNEKRRKIAKNYNERLANLANRGFLTTPIEEKWAKHVYHMYVIRTSLRDKLRHFLKEKSIGTGIHYPIPISEQPAIVKKLGRQEVLRNTKLSAATVLSLPIFPGLSAKELDYVCDKVHEFFSTGLN
jgi:dTDP-4-amino-4,6-dideoxygalactose transaminase